MDLPVSKSQGDQNNYDVFELQNGLRVMLIDDGHQELEGD